MKKMTCRQMGGPCDVEITGSTPQEMVDNGAKHVMEVGDEEHKKVLAMMEEMKGNPEEAQKWNEEFERKFNELPESGV